MKKLALLLLLPLMFSGCKKIENIEYYRVDEGKHYAHRRPVVVVDERIDFKFYVHPSWIYPASHDVGWSKLTGLTHNGVHVNSGRLVWRCRGGESIHLAGYFYLNKHRYIYEFQGAFGVGNWYEGSVWFSEGKYHVRVGEETVSHFMTWRNPTGLYLCHPYFGGVLPAPHDVHFYIEFH